MIAILFELTGTTFLKISYGFTRFIPSLLTFAFYVVSFTSLAIALKKIDVGIAYAIWSGAGTALIACVGVFYFGEVLTPWKVIFIALIIIGVIGLNILEGVLKV